MTLKGKRILITGASFIGSHLIRELVKKNVANIRVVNLSKKHIYLFRDVFSEIEFFDRDLRDINQALKSVKGIDIVFHLAADHGGRGYLEIYQGNTASNFLLDGSVFYACLKQGIQKVIYASSGCVYPNFLQNNTNKLILLKETMVKPPYDADNIYGWAKLMGEMTLTAYHKDFGLPSAIGRLFSVYGEGATESHAIIASIAKTYIKQDPYMIWGDGNQVRNWIYVGDVVKGLVLLAEKIYDATPINLGAQDRITVKEMVETVWRTMDFKPKKVKFVEMPTGPLNRVADNSLARKMLDWRPRYSFSKGLKRTIDWYVSYRNKKQAKNNLEKESSLHNA